MILKILGCGTSTGVPIPGCSCPVCVSGKEKNIRTKTAALLCLPDNRKILIDASTDLRHQALRWEIDRLDAVLLTHSHADHILGLDDLRAFNFKLKGPIPCYATPRTLVDVRRIFKYIFEPDPDYEGGLLPQIKAVEIDGRSAFELCGIVVRPFDLVHGRQIVTGFRFGDIAYATDCKTIPEESMQVLRGVRYLVLDGLRVEQHRTHMSIDEAVECATRIGAERTYLTHMTHSVDYDEVMARLPAHVALAYDGLEIGSSTIRS